MNKLIRINLEIKDIQIVEIDPEETNRYLGGAGFAALIFNREVPADIKPFDSENLLIFSVGPFCGTAVPFCGRHFVMAKSPLTGIIGESSAGGFFGKELKSAGFDHIMIKGKSSEPVFLWINDDHIEIKDASELWTKGTRETEEIIKNDLKDPSIKIASIGPAGENLVKYASIISETGHAAGRCGLGAVMGSKRLKAIAIKGTKNIVVKDKGTLNDAVKEIREMVKASPMANVMSDLGTLVHMDNYVSAGDVPIKNFNISRWRGTKSIGAYALKERGERKHYACFNCPVACRGKIQFEGEWIAWPEYETLAMMGSNLMIDDLESLIKWNKLMNNYGMDVISFGGTMGVFLEALEKNLIKLDMNELGFKSDPETNEYKIWGDSNVIENLIELTVYRKEIGDHLAEGVKNLCKIYNLPEDLQVHGKGLEIPAHEPRANNMTALDYATTSRGAFHCYEPLHLSFLMNFKEEIGLTEKIEPFSADNETIEAVKKIQDASEAYNACGGCIFGFWYTHRINPWVNAYNSITGSSLSVKQWVNAGEAIFNMKRKYNLDCGISKEDDTIGQKFFKPIPKGGTKKNVPPLDEMVKKYYELRGWNEDGIPP